MVGWQIRRYAFRERVEGKPIYYNKCITLSVQVISQRNGNVVAAKDWHFTSWKVLQCCQIGLSSKEKVSQLQFNALIIPWNIWACRILVKRHYLFLWLSTQIIHQNISYSSGQLPIQSHLLLRQKLRLRLIISKGREEFGFVGHTRVSFHDI